MNMPVGLVLLAPLSVGEMADKIAILRIKSVRIEDPAKLVHVRRELAALEQAFAPALAGAAPQLAAHLARLQDINEKLWTIEDDIRACERVGDFGETFVALARSVYLTNDERARVKLAINIAAGSAYQEQKSYSPLA